MYAETQMHIQHIHLIDGTVVKVRMTSIELFEKLNHDKRFFKCGSTYIINLEKIKEITTKTIALDNNERLPMQRRHYRTLIDKYTEYPFEDNLR